MLLKGIEFENFKPFKGKQYIDFSVNSNIDKNIILIGGLNNCGKTTILEAIKLCLYGNKNKELWSSQESYNKYLITVFNLHAYKEGKKEFGIMLEFEKDGVQGSSILTITRKWTIDKNNDVHEEFILEEDDALIEADKSQEEDYVDYLIPYGVSQFFLFDGEKVQKMADDNEYEDNLISAIHAILNISFYNDLILDLETYEKKQKQEGAQYRPSELKSIEWNLTKVDEDIEITNNNINEIQEQISLLEYNAENISKYLRRFGVSEVTVRLELEEEKNNLISKKEVLLNNLKSYAKDTLPFIVLIPLLKELEKRLRLEEVQEKEQSINQESYSKFELFSNSLFEDSKPNPELTYSQKQFLKARSFLIWDEIFPKPKQLVSEIIHDVSPQERKNIYQKIKSVFNDIGSGELQRIISDLEYGEERLRKINNLEKKIPDDQTYLEKENELKNTYQQIGSLKTETENLKVNIKELTDKKAGIARRYHEAQKNISLSEKAKKKVAVSEKIRKTLKEFVKKLTEIKSIEVKSYLLQMFRDLLREGGEIARFDIDPQTFEATLISNDGEVITKRSLSAGAKEIYAISLLWALSQASNRNLPMVIDTPLGRLDSIHRDNIVTKYLPRANRQVVVLSTNEEIDEKLYNNLKPYIARTYVLNKVNLQHTVISTGYFFD